MMGYTNRPTLPPKKWAYGYRISPPMTQARLRAIRHLIEEEHASAKLQTRTWQGRFVVEEQVTHILVVSDSPDQELEINRRLEAELTRLEAAFQVTPSQLMDDEEGPPSPTPGATPAP